MKQQIFIVAFLGVFLSCCATKEQTSTADRPHATVVLRDGTKVTGAVMENSAAELKIAGDDNISRTIPTSQIKSIDYGEALTAPPSQTPLETQTPERSSTPKPAATKSRRDV